MTPHVHKGIINAYAEGAQIQIRCSINKGWQDIENPAFLEKREYRVKPSPREYRVAILRDCEINPPCLYAAIEYKNDMKCYANLGNFVKYVGEWNCE